MFPESTAKLRSTKGGVNLTYAGKPGVYFPRHITQDRRKRPTVGLRDVTLCCYRRVCYVWTEIGLQRGVDIVSHAGYATYEAWSIVSLDFIVNVTNL